MRTRFTDLVGCSVPVQQAPMGSVGGPALVRAALDAGAMGTIALAGVPADAVAGYIDGFGDDLRSRPVGGNFVVPFIDDPAVVTTCAERVRVVDLYHARPDPALIGRAHAAGALVCWQVGTLEEAREAVDLGVELLAVRGIEGGGRMAGDRAMWPLLCDVLDAVGDRVPVLAAGGIGTGRGLAAALAAGADGVRIGTVLVATVESGAHPAYKQALIAAEATDSVLTDAYSVGWPGGPHPARVLRQCIEAARSTDAEFVGTAVLGGVTEDIPRFAPHPPSTAFDGKIEAMAHYAGESVTFVRAIEPAGAIIDRMVVDAARLLAAVPS